MWSSADNGDRGRRTGVRRWWRLGVATVVVGLLLPGAAAHAQEPPHADLSIVSMTANVRHAKVGQDVTFTIVARNNGPEAADLNVVEDPWQLYGDLYQPADFALVEESCDFGISPDTPACEYGPVQPGRAVTTMAVMTVKETASRDASNTACVFSWEGPIDDPDTANDCVTTTLAIVGKRGH